jgi:hypothetical protein
MSAIDHGNGDERDAVCGGVALEGMTKIVLKHQANIFKSTGCCTATAILNGIQDSKKKKLTNIIFNKVSMDIRTNSIFLK